MADSPTITIAKLDDKELLQSIDNLVNSVKEKSNEMANSFDSAVERMKNKFNELGNLKIDSGGSSDGGSTRRAKSNDKETDSVEKKNTEYERLTNILRTQQGELEELRKQEKALLDTKQESSVNRSAQESIELNKKESESVKNLDNYYKMLQFAKQNAVSAKTTAQGEIDTEKAKLDGLVEKKRQIEESPVKFTFVGHQKIDEINTRITNTKSEIDDIAQSLGNLNNKERLYQETIKSFEASYGKDKATQKANMEKAFDNAYGADIAANKDAIKKMDERWDAYWSKQRKLAEEFASKLKKTFDAVTEKDFKKYSNTEGAQAWLRTKYYDMGLNTENELKSRIKTLNKAVADGFKEFKPELDVLEKLDRKYRDTLARRVKIDTARPFSDSLSKQQIEDITAYNVANKGISYIAGIKDELLTRQKEATDRLTKANRELTDAQNQNNQASQESSRKSSQIQLLDQQIATQKGVVAQKTADLQTAIANEEQANKNLATAQQLVSNEQNKIAQSKNNQAAASNNAAAAAGQEKTQNEQLLSVQNAIADKEAKIERTKAAMTQIEQASTSAIRENTAAKKENLTLDQQAQAKNIAANVKPVIKPELSIEDLKSQAKTLESEIATITKQYGALFAQDKQQTLNEVNNKIREMSQGTSGAVSEENKLTEATKQHNQELSKTKDIQDKINQSKALTPKQQVAEVITMPANNIEQATSKLNALNNTFRTLGTELRQTDAVTFNKLQNEIGKTEAALNRMKAAAAWKDFNAINTMPAKSLDEMRAKADLMKESLNNLKNLGIIDDVKMKRATDTYDALKQKIDALTRTTGGSGTDSAISTMQTNLELLREKLREAHSQYSSFILLAKQSHGNQGQFTFATENIHRYEEEIRNIIASIRALQTGIQGLQATTQTQGHSIQNFIREITSTTSVGNTELAQMKVFYEQMTAESTRTGRSISAVTEEVKKQAAAIRETQEWKSTGSVVIGDTRYYDPERANASKRDKQILLSLEEQIAQQLERQRAQENAAADTAARRAAEEKKTADILSSQRTTGTFDYSQELRSRMYAQKNSIAFMDFTISDEQIAKFAELYNKVESLRKEYGKLSEADNGSSFGTKLKDQLADASTELSKFVGETAKAIINTKKTSSEAAGSFDELKRAINSATGEVKENINVNNTETASIAQLSKELKMLKDAYNNLSSSKRNGWQGESIRNRIFEVESALAKVRNEASRPVTLSIVTSLPEKTIDDISFKTQMLRSYAQGINVETVTGQQELTKVQSLIDNLNDKAKNLQKTASQIRFEKIGEMPEDTFMNVGRKLVELRRHLNDLKNQPIINEKEVKRTESLIDKLSQKFSNLGQTRGTEANIKSAINVEPKTLDEIARAMQRIQAIRQNLNIDTQRTQIEQLNNTLATLRKRQDEILNKNQQMIASNTALGRSWNYMKNRLAFYFSVGASTQFVRSLIEVRSQYEMNERALGILIDSAERGTRIFNELSQMALVSPYTLIELSAAAKQLTAYDVAARDVVDTTRRLADMASAVGIPIERLTYALGQIKAYGYLNSRDARMFANAGIPLVKELSQYYTELEGRMVSTADVYDRMKKKTIDYNEVMQVLNKMTDEGGKFFNFQAKMAETLKVQLANLTLAWNNMLNDIGKSEQGILSGAIGLLKEMFLQWKNINRVLGDVAITFGVVKMAQLSYLLLLRKTSTAAASTIVVGKKLTDVFGTLGSTMKQVLTSGTSWLYLLAFAAGSAVMSIVRGNEAMKEFNKTLRENSKNTYEDLDKFLKQYSKLKDSLYKEGTRTVSRRIVTNDPAGGKLERIENREETIKVNVDIDEKEAVKAWEAIRERIELSTHASDEYITRLMAIENISERLRQGFSLLENMHAVSAALKNLGDDGIELKKDWSDWWNLGLFPDGTIENLKDTYSWLGKINEEFGSLENARKIATTDVTDEGLPNTFKDEAQDFIDEYEKNLAQFREDLKLTTDSVMQFIKSMGWSKDADKINEVFKQVTDNLISQNMLDPQQAYTLQVEIEEARSRAAKEALRSRLNDLAAASHEEQNREAKTAIVEEWKKQKQIYDAWDTYNGRTKVEWERFTKWLKEQHISETTAMFRNMEAKDIASLNFMEGKHSEWVKKMVTQYAKEHKMSYDEAFDYLKSWVQSANTWSVTIPVMLNVQEQSDFQKEFSKRVREKYGETALERFAKVSPNQNEDLATYTDNAWKNLKKLREDEKKYNNDNTEWGKKKKQEISDEIKLQEQALKLFNQRLEKETKGNKKDKVLEALKMEIDLVKKLQSDYDKLTKSGANSAEALMVVRNAYGKTINLINAKMGAIGLPKLDMSIITGKDPNKVLAFFDKVKDTLSMKGLSNVERMKAVEGVIQEFTVSAKTYNLDKITKGLNNELGKLKEEYELAVELDASPEMGNLFSSLFGLDESDMPRTFDQLVDKAQKKIDEMVPNNIGVDIKVNNLDDVDIPKDSIVNVSLSVPEKEADKIKEIVPEVVTIPTEVDGEKMVKVSFFADKDTLDEVNNAVKDREITVRVDSKDVDKLNMKIDDSMIETKKIDMNKLLDINAWEEFKKTSGQVLGSDMLKIIEDYRNYLVSTNKKIVSETNKSWDSLVQKYGNLQSKLIRIQKDTVSEQVGIIKKFEKEVGKEDLNKAVQIQADINKSNDTEEIARLSAELAPILKKVSEQNPLALKVVTSVQNKSAEETSKAFWEDFKRTDLYTSTFEDMSNLSTMTIDMLIDKLDALKDKVKEDPASMKALIKQLESARDEMYNRNPFKAIWDGLNGIKDARDKVADADKRVEDAEKELNEVMKDPSASPEDKARAWMKYDNAVENSRKAHDNLKKTQSKIVGGLNGLQNKLGEISNAFSAVSNAFREFGDEDTAKTIDDITFGFTAMISVLSAVIAIITVLESTHPWLLAIAATLGVIVSLAKMLSGNDNEAIDKAIKDSENAVKRLEIAYKGLEDAANKAYGASASGAKRATIANKELQLAEIKRQIQLERSRDAKDRDEGRILDLESQYKDLVLEIRNGIGDIVNDMLGISSAGDGITSLVEAMVDAFKNGEDAMQAFSDSWDKMIDNMILKLITTQYMQKAWDNVMNVLQKKEEEYLKQSADDKAAAQAALTKSELYGDDNWRRLYEWVLENYGFWPATEFGLLGDVPYLDTVKEGYTTLKEQYQDEYNKYIDNLKKQISDADLASEKASEEYLEWSLDYMMNEGKDYMTEVGQNLADALGQWYTFGEDKDSQLSALQQGIQGITEDTAGALEAYMNSVSQQVYYHSTLLEEILAAVLQIGGIDTLNPEVMERVEAARQANAASLPQQTGDTVSFVQQIRDIVSGFPLEEQTGIQAQMLLQLQQSYQVQASIHSLLDGWNNASGQAVRVELVS